MNKHDIIMLSAKQGGGKTTLMNEIMRAASRAGRVPHNLIFAQTIYDIHNFALKTLEWRGIKRDIVKDGPLLQMLGTEWGRNTIDPDIWVKCLQGEMRNISGETGNPKHLFIISDCRFENEFDGVDAFKVRLEASRDTRYGRCSQWRYNEDHVSETSLDDYARQGKFDCYVDTEKDLASCVNQILTAHGLYRAGETYNNGWETVKEKYYGYNSGRHSDTELQGVSTVDGQIGLAPFAGGERDQDVDSVPPVPSTPEKE